MIAMLAVSSDPLVTGVMAAADAAMDVDGTVAVVTVSMTVAVAMVVDVKLISVLA